MGNIAIRHTQVWMLQVARNLLDVKAGVLTGGKVLVMDRDTKFSHAFRHRLIREGVLVIRLPPRSPNLNAHAERFVRSIKEECLSKIVPIGQGMVRHARGEYIAHYHSERNHQGIGNRFIAPEPIALAANGGISRRTRLGRLLNYYVRCLVVGRVF